MSENNKNTKDDKQHSEEDDTMNATMDKTQTPYNKQIFLVELEESIKEMKQKLNNKSNQDKSSWRDLFDKKEK